MAFLINVPIGAIAIAGSFWAIRESRDASIKQHVDFLGILLAGLALGSIVFGAIEGQNYGWLQAARVFNIGPIRYPPLAPGVTQIPPGTPSFIPFTFVFGVVVLAVFVFVELWQERRGGEPLFEFGMLVRYRSFRLGLLTILIVALGEFGMVLVISIFFQLAKDLDPFQTGLRFLPFALATAVAAPMAGMLSSRFGAKWVVTAGMTCEATSLFWLSRVLTVDTSYWSLLPPLLLYGAGVGLTIAQLANIVLSDIPRNKAGVASGTTNTIRQIGASLGIAIIGAVLFGAFADQTKPLIEQSTAFQDFGSRVAANTAISKEAKVVGAQFAAFGNTAKKALEASLDNNEGFDLDQSPLDVALDQLKSQPLAKNFLKLQGANLDDPAVIARVKRDLGPDADILRKDLLHVLGLGFSSAARSSALIASIFVACGALSSLMLPKTRRREDADAVVMAD